MSELNAVAPKAPGAKCNECPLKDCKPVMGHGPDKAKVILVGEAPGKDEVIRGIPFVGKSGQLINKVLEYHDIKREDVYVTNACLCRPRGNATPNAQAIAACNERLLAEVSSREPSRVIAAGAVATKALLGTKEGITKLRAGGPKPSPHGSYHVIPTWHPAAALRDPDKFPSIVGDIGKVTRIQVGWEATKYKVIDDTHKAIDMLQKQVGHSPQLVLDVENDHHASDYIEPDWLCIGISHRPGASVVYDERVCKDPVFQNELRRHLADPGITWGYQNGQYDIKTLWSFAPEARVDEDTILMHYMTDERKGTHDLEQIGTEILGAPSWKSDMRTYLKNENSSLRDLPKDVLHRYNAQDVDLTHRLIEPLQEMMRKDDVTSPYYQLLIPGTNALAVAEYQGVLLDMDYLTELESHFDRNLETKEATLRAIHDVNPRSSQQLKALFESLGFPVENTRKATLKDLAADNKDVAPFVKALLDYKKDHKLESTYVRGYRRRARRGRIHPTFKAYGTETGRLSSSDPNVQNIPRPDDDPSIPNIRNVFVADPGCTFLSADYSNIEYRIAAVLSKDPWLLEQFRANRSLHKAMAGAIFGEDYTDGEYTRAKVLNFTVLYEGGPGRVAADLGISYKDAEKMIEQWHAQARRIRPWQAGIKREVKENGYLTSYFGRKRRFWLVTQDNWYHVAKEGLNFPVQSPASDLTLMSLIRLVPVLKGIAQPVITVHDSLTFQCKLEDVEEVAHTMAKVMSDTPFAEHVPTPVDIKVGPQWGTGKEMEVVYG